MNGEYEKGDLGIINRISYEISHTLKGIKAIDRLMTSDGEDAYTLSAELAEHRQRIVEEALSHLREYRRLGRNIQEAVELVIPTKIGEIERAIFFQ